VYGEPGCEMLASEGMFFSFQSAADTIDRPIPVAWKDLKMVE
jgi:hypothetical protein